MDDALRMYHNLYTFQRYPEEMVALDEFQALVHQSRRVYGDLGAHRPAGVVQRLVDGDPGQVEFRARPERAAAGGDEQPGDTAQALAPQALPDGGGLGVDRPDR